VVSAGKREVESAEVTLRLAEDHDRIAQSVNDVVVRRLFAVGLDLQSALGLMGEHRATPRICHAVGELDQAIRDLRDAIFGWDRDVADSRGLTGNERAAL
jgi:signal transduction histidine kinase